MAYDTAEKKSAYSKAYYAANKEKVLLRTATTRKANPERNAAYTAAYRKRNPEKITAYSKAHSKGRTYNADQQAAYYEANKEVIAEKLRVWRKANPDKINASGAERRASKLKRTPPWFSMESVVHFYTQCSSVSESTGTPHHVDHIVPLRGRLVSGLHVAENLTVIPAKDNGVKSNKFDPMTYEWWPSCCPKPPQKVTLTKLKGR